MDRTDNDLCANVEEFNAEAKIATLQPTQWFRDGPIYTRASVHQGQVLYQNCNCNACDLEFEDDYRNFSLHCHDCQCRDCVCPLRVQQGWFSPRVVPLGACDVCLHCTASSPV